MAKQNYSETEKRTILASLSKLTVAQAAKKAKVSAATIYTWKADINAKPTKVVSVTVPATPKKKSSTPAATIANVADTYIEEAKRLREENRELRKQNDMLQRTCDSLYEELNQ